MGTNFYVQGHIGDGDPAYHIGKRSAAGWYCWDCRVSLCKDGLEAIHSGTTSWYERCPLCRKRPNEPWKESAISRELGFAKRSPAKKTGVKSCCSFSWAMPKSRIYELPFDEYPDPEGKFTIIEDEYGRLYTLEEFEQVLEECPIQYERLLGQRFS